MGLLMGIVVSLSAPPNLSRDVPLGTDVMLRIELDAFFKEGGEAWEELRTLLPFQPGLGAHARPIRTQLLAAIKEIETLTGANLRRKSAMVSIAIDLDAAGGMVLSAIIRGAVAKELRVPREPGGDQHRFEVDGHPALRKKGRPYHWTFVSNSTKTLGVGTILIVGDERGFQRQLRRHLTKALPLAREEPMARAVAGLRRPAPFLLAFTIPPPLRKEIKRELRDVGQIFSKVVSGNITARPGSAEIHLVSDTKKHQKTVAHGIKALDAFAQGAVSIMRGGTELLMGLEAAGAKSKLLPRGLKAKKLEPLLESWLDSFEMTTEVRQRRPYATEVVLKVSSYRALAAVGMLLIGALGIDLGSAAPGDLDHQVEDLLMTLRDGQRLHKEFNGAYVACGPVPAKIPTKPFTWPRKTCFDRVAFGPDAAVPVQLEALVQDGRLVLVARADPDGDGIPRVWYLDDESNEVTGVAATHRDDEAKKEGASEPKGPSS